MEIRFLTEAVRIRDNDSELRNIFRKYKNLEPWLKEIPYLSDDRYGKWFVMDNMKNAYGEDCRLLCFSNTRVELSLEGHSYHDYIHLFFLYDVDMTAKIIGGRTFGALIPASNIDGRRRSSKFVRDMVKSLSRMTDPYAMLERITSTSKKYLAHEW